MKAGHFVFGVETKVVDEEGNVVPDDGHAQGELYVRGPWVASAYYNNAEATAGQFTDDGWFRTGDIVSIDDEGYLTICDRAKDLIKSGGEWISSIDLENAAVAHPEVAEAAAIAIRTRSGPSGRCWWSYAGPAVRSTATASSPFWTTRSRSGGCPTT